MNFLKIITTTLNKGISKGINKSLIVYTNNTRVIRSKTRGFEKKFFSEAKEFIYEFLIFLETRRGWYFKWLVIVLVACIAYSPLCYILRKYKTEMLYPHIAINHLENYQKDNFTPNMTDEHYKNKFMTAYWANYL
jgi:hypothetical protein